MKRKAPEQSLILIVDDEPHIRRVLADRLKHAGFEVAGASDGELAYAAACKRLPALVLTDQRMPGGISGVELARRLRANPATTAVPVVLLTAFEDDILREELSVTATNVKAIEVKPFSPKRLTQLIVRLIGGDSAPDAQNATASAA
jgi:CheY-like chemotaxis protein